MRKFGITARILDHELLVSGEAYILYEKYSEIECA